MQAIQIKNFNFAYNGTPILHDIQINVAAGEYLSIIGPNGAGKSTLLKALCKILKIESGIIELFGKNVQNYSQKEIGQIIGYVPQIKELGFSFTVEEFVMMGRYPFLKNLQRETQKDREIVEQMLSLTQITHLKNRQIDFLSGGERQKAYLAASLAQQPKILLLDEPTTHLDPKHQVEIQHVISRIAKGFNITVLHVTHDLNHIVSISHKVAAIKDGRLLFWGTPAEVITQKNLKIIFDTPFYFLPHPKTQQPIIVPEDK